MQQYRVINMSGTRIEGAAKVVTAASPEKAAALLLGEMLVRDGNPENLRARVYVAEDGQPMQTVSLFRKVGEPIIF
ncbi:MAG: hypothetical protein P0Y65_14325 [Candidatus Devosia phytovorans]|uniref:Uncharacterized protein n=1 Tax=Candidatus Devosia phytovorans TaxID=3121372 RepID=A0AAJ5VU30_9HYPH|nr:hypothetical protein [Devosia sp.]WEK03364.1 MAG: hypothetical protein P0Y65_14325 [Devosia sp.]